MNVRQSLKKMQTRIANSFPRYNFNTLKEVALNAAFIQKLRRSVVEQTYIESVDRIVDQPWPYRLLKVYANNHPFLRIVHSARIREVVKNRWDVVEKFAKKCVTCGQEFSEPIEECPDCGPEGFLRDPNPQEKKRLEQFLKDPNRDDEFIDIIKSLLKDNLAVDDWYLSVHQLAGNNYALYNEDSATIFICTDKHGRKGNGVYFCRHCWIAEQNEKTYNKPGPCPDCSEQLLETAYVQKIAGNIKARFGEDEIIHGNSDPWLPGPYGNSKVVAVLMQLRTSQAMSSGQFRTYSKGHVDKIIGLKGEEQSKANEIADQAQKQTEKVKIDSFTGRIGREPLATLFIGTRDGIDVHDVMPDPDKMQSLEWMKFWFVEIVGGIYGVQPVMMNAQVRGPGGYFQRMQIIVDNDATKETQAMIEDPINEQLLPKLGIFDWQFKFNEIEARNELEEAQIWQSKVAAGTMAVEAGLKAELTDEGELKISGEFEKPEMPSQATAYLMPKPPKVPPPKQSQPFSQDKMRKGKTWVVTELEEK